MFFGRFEPEKIRKNSLQSGVFSGIFVASTEGKEPEKDSVQLSSLAASISSVGYRFLLDNMLNGEKG